MSIPTTVRLCDVATIERDMVAPDDIPSGTTYVGLEHVESSGDFVGVGEVASGELASTKFAFNPSHVLYGKLRPYLSKIARPNFVGVCTTEIVPIKPGPRLDRDYLFHFLRLPHMIAFATSRCSGANLPRLSPKMLAEFEIPLPPLAEQKRIAAVLDKADALRAKRRQALATLDTLLQSVFLDMFGDPVTNPKGWPTKRLDELVRSDDTINYGVVQPGDDVPDGVPLVRVGDFASRRIDQVSIKRIEPAIEKAYGRSRLRGDEVLISCVGSIGMIALADDSLKGFNIARAVARVPLSDGMSREFVAAFLETAPIQRYFTAETRTVSQPTLNIKQISETKVLVPPLDRQRAFERSALSIEEARASIVRSGQVVDALFASLQSAAFAGTLFDGQAAKPARRAVAV